MTASYCHPKPCPRRARPHALALAVAALAAAPVQAADFFWTAGDFVTGVTAPEPLLASDTLFIQAGGVKRFVGGGFTNQGLVRWQSDALLGGNGASVLNSGTWESESDANSLVWAFGGRPVFTNGGTFRKTAGVNTNVGSWTFINNGGLIDAQVGRITFNGDDNRFGAGSRFRGAGEVALTGTSQFTGAFRADNLRLAGGSTNGAGALLTGGVAQAGGAMAWSGGDLTGDWTIAAGSTLTAQDGGTKRQLGSSITNFGTLRYDSAEQLQGGNSSHLVNHGLIEVNGSATFNWNYGGQARYTSEAGSTIRAANNATLSFGQVALTSNGASFEAQAGSAIAFNGNSNIFNAGSTFTGDIRASGTSTYIGQQTANQLRWTGGTQLGGDGNPGSQANLAGSYSWEAGDLQRSFVIDNGAAVQASTAAIKRQVGSQIVNNGSFVWDTTQQLQGGNSSSFTNNGLVQARQTATFNWNYGGQAAWVNNSTGVVHATSGATLSFGQVALTSHGGRFEADAGAAIAFTGDSNVFNAGTTFIGEMRASGTSTYVGQQVANNMRWTGGTQFGGNGNPGSQANLAGGYSWEAGDLQRAFVIDAGATVQASTGSTKRQVGSQLVNNGSFVWDTTQQLQGGNSSSFTNNALLQVRQSASFNWNYGGQAAWVNNGSGLVHATNGATLSFGAVALTSHGGRFVADGGAQIVYGGESNRFNGGTRFVGLNVSTGAARFVDQISSDNLVWRSGTQYGGDGNPGSYGRMAGQVAWEGGDIRERFEIQAAATLTASGPATKRQVGGELVNNGTVLWATDASYQGGNSSRLQNNGRFELAGDADIVWGFGGQHQVANAGLIIKTAGSGDSSMSNVALSNTGTMDVRSGSITLPANFANAGTLMGTGAFNVGGTLTNNGTIAPGASTGTLTINGNLLQSALGTLDTELTNLADHDLLLVSGNVALNGTLALSCLGNCLMSVGDEVVILDAGGQLSGSFASVTMAGFGSGAFDVVYDFALDRVLLRVTENVTPVPVPEPGTYALMAAGLAAVGFMARRRRRG